MIAVLGKHSSILSSIEYNIQKVEQGLGCVLYCNKLPQVSLNGHYAKVLYAHFEPYLLVNFRSKRIVRHISLNPHPSDVVSDTNLKKIARYFMNKTGYKDQPYIVFKHSDLERVHVHIVSVSTNLQGRLVTGGYDCYRAIEVARKIETKFNLIPLLRTKDLKLNPEKLQVVDYTKGNLKSQVSAVLRHVPKYYRFSSFEQYNDLLSLFNIKALKVKTPSKTYFSQGIVYVVLAQTRQINSAIYKSSLFGQAAGYNALEQQFRIHAKRVSEPGHLQGLKLKVAQALQKSSSIGEFQNQLIQYGISGVFNRSNSESLAHGCFIDHQSKCVFSEDQLMDSMDKALNKLTWPEILPKPIAQSQPMIPNVAAVETRVLSTNIDPMFAFLFQGSQGLTKSNGLKSLDPIDLEPIQERSLVRGIKIR